VWQWALNGHGIILRSAWDVETAADVGAVTTSRLSNSAKVRACVQFLPQWLQAHA